MHLCSCKAYPTPKLIAQSDNTFGGLPDFLSSKTLEVKNVTGDYLAMKNWKKVKTEKGILSAGNTKGGSITVLLTSCLTGLESAV